MALHADLMEKRRIWRVMNLPGNKGRKRDSQSLSSMPLPSAIANKMLNLDDVSTHGRQKIMPAYKQIVYIYILKIEHNYMYI